MKISKAVYVRRSGSQQERLWAPNTKSSPREWPWRRSQRGDFPPVAGQYFINSVSTGDSSDPHRGSRWPTRESSRCASFGSATIWSGAGCWERRTRQKLGETSHQPTVDPRRTSPRRQLILWLVLMTVLYNSGFVHRDHHRLRDQLRDLRRNTCWTAALFRRLRVYTRRHAFHFSTIDSIVAAPMATFSPAFAPIATKVGVGTQKGTLIAVRRLVTAALFRRLRASYGKPWLITLFRAAPVLYILAMVLGSQGGTRPTHGRRHLLGRQGALGGSGWEARVPRQRSRCLEKLTWNP